MKNYLFDKINKLVRQIKRKRKISLLISGAITTNLREITRKIKYLSDIILKNLMVWIKEHIEKQPTKLKLDKTENLSCPLLIIENEFLNTNYMPIYIQIQILSFY